MYQSTNDSNSFHYNVPRISRPETNSDNKPGSQYDTPVAQGTNGAFDPSNHYSRDHSSYNNANNGDNNTHNADKINHGYINDNDVIENKVVNETDDAADDESPEPELNYDKCIQEPLGQFGIYTIYMLITVEVGMAVVAGSMLSPTYHKLQPIWSCEERTTVDTAALSVDDIAAVGFNASHAATDCSCPASSRHYGNTDGFHSLSRQFSLICDDHWKFTLIASLLMIGGLCGALTFGHLADRFGRKWMGTAALTGTSVITFIMMWSVNYAMAAVFIILLGFFGGGYMVVGIATVIEYVGRDYRLLVSCLHGWPYGLMLMALLGYITKSWHYYHLSLAICGIPFILAWIFSVESPRWLIRMNRLDEARKSINIIARWNRVPSPVSETEDRLLPALYQLESVHREKLKDYNYLDLVKHPRVRRYTLIMMYAWFTSGLVSWGIYTNLGTFFGVVYLNIFLTGFGKAIAGFIPLLFDACGLGRRPIILTAIAVVGVCMWGIVGIYGYLGEKPKEGALGSLVTAFAIIGVAAMDPAWKINHLYANELFPTVVRNMANGACNLGSRLASIIAPGIAALESAYLPAPYILFGILMILQFAILAKYLPEYRGKPLLDNLPPSGNTWKMKFSKSSKVAPQNQASVSLSKF